MQISQSTSLLRELLPPHTIARETSYHPVTARTTTNHHATSSQHTDDRVGAIEQFNQPPTSTFYRLKFKYI